MANLDKVAGEIQSEFAGHAANIDWAVSGVKEEFVRLSQQLNQQLSAALSIFAWQPQANLPTDFPSRASLVPILTTPRARQRPNDQVDTRDRGEIEDDIMNQGVGLNHSNLPGLRMDIPLFERDRPP